MASGEILNDYSGLDWSLSDPLPTTPWAMYLAGDRTRFDFICFDLDSSRGNAPYDAGRLSHWLDELNIPHLVCNSGPTGGRHVWLGLTDPADAGQVRTVALLAAQLLPSLDPTPLSNPATGCVRPPGAPHRLGGTSEPQGPLTPLTSTPVAAESIQDLLAFLVDAGAELATPTGALLRGMTVDPDGHPYIAGPKRELSTRVAALIDTATTGDTSYTLAAVLAGCAHARWRYSDILTLVDTPAFEHIRTLRGKAGNERVPRTPAGRIRALNSAWNSAVRYVAAHPLNGTGNDADYQTRLTTVLGSIERAQERADAMPGLWGADRASSASRTRRGTHSTRAVLDALCLYLAQSAQPVIEADLRRLSADTGYGRSTVHTALRTLTTSTSDDPESAWVIPIGDAESPHGQRYRLSKRFSTEAESTNRTQVLARPAALSPAPNLSYWTTRLTQELQPLRQDVFAAPRSLGRTAGLVFKHLAENALATVDDLTKRTGLDPARVRSALRRLHSNRIAQRLPHGWTRGQDTATDRTADALGVHGYLQHRRDRYSFERAVWGWWQAEYTWMTKTGKKRRGRRSPTGVALFTQTDRPEYARYPRGPGHRGDHREARRLIEAGALSTPTLAAA
ncbi:hypothetical protein DDQ50_16405 [Amnibacterium flavum]|uniref:Uncharacterized protein n=2 Tax=Amnibacterium flavum TaxID=2173173 RepID=A0A2V1HQM7_9MICO|nr:hypothetical protein DDQ50_16405 [Amnibacterium flavum]